MADQQVEKIEIVGDRLFITLSVDKSELARGSILNYNLSGEVLATVKKTIVDEILAENKEKIKEDILLNVNWAELVRSEIAQRIIKEAANRNNY